MPVVHVNVWEGFGKEKAKTVIQDITKVFVNLGIQFAIQGQQLSETKAQQAGGQRSHLYFESDIEGRKDLTFGIE